MKKPAILIVKLSAIGDVMHTLPVLNALRRHYPNAHITWLVEEASADLVKNHPALDRVLVSRRKSWIRGLRSSQWRAHLRDIIRFIRSLRDCRYDMVFDFQAALKGAAWVALARGKRKIGFGRGMEHQECSYWVLNERIPAVSMEIHALDRGMMMLRAAGIACHDIEYHLPITADHRIGAQQLLSEKGLGSGQPFVVLNPMAKWQTKLWDQRNFAELADRIQTGCGVPIVFTGGPEDQSYINSIIGHMKTKGETLAGRTDLMTLAALLQAAALMITTDTGPMHIAAAVGTPTVVLFGPTAPWRTGPYGKGHRIVRADLACNPCFKRRCPENRTCMAAIRVEQVMAAATELLSR
ncbi:MAG: glycosyltransferase family 9 protein [Pseudomonadota bacterium]